MELTGPRRYIHTALFATVAWAGFLILFLASSSGTFVIGYYDPEMVAFYAGSPFSIALAFAAVVVAARAMQRPTLARALASSKLLALLVVMAALHRYLQIALIEAENPVHVVHHSAGDVVHVAVWLVPIAGLVLAAALGALGRWEQHTRAHVMRAPTSR
jgi:hypothetical protein